MPSIFFPFRRIFNFIRRKRVPRHVRREMEDLRKRTERAETDFAFKGDQLRVALEEAIELRNAARSAPICASPDECGKIGVLKENVLVLDEKSATVQRDLERVRGERQDAFLRTIQMEAQLKTAKRERDACATAVLASVDDCCALFCRTEELCGDVESAEKRIAAMVALLQTADEGQRKNSAASEELATLREENAELQKRRDEAEKDLANANDDIRDLRRILQDHLDHLCS